MDPQYKPIWLTTLWPLVRKLNDLHIDYQKEQSQKLHYAYAGRKKDVERIGNELKVIVERRKNQIELSDFLDTLYYFNPPHGLYLSCNHLASRFMHLLTFIQKQPFKHASEHSRYRQLSIILNPQSPSIRSRVSGPNMKL